jgi:glycosyltransferase involved in cell wall biosynthesis
VTGEIRLLAISPSCFRVVNRAVYRALAERGVTVELIIPRQYFVLGEWQDSEPDQDDGYKTTRLDLTGNHQRLQRFSGLSAVVKAFRPTHIYVDADPSSVMALQAAIAAPKAKISTITAENLPTKTRKHVIQALRDRNLREAANICIKSVLRQLSRPRMDRVFTLSEDGSEVTQNMGFTVAKLPLGYDTRLFYVQREEIRAATRERLGLTCPTIAYFGRQVPEKGIHILLEALAQISDRPWQLLMDHFAVDSAYARQLTTQIDALGLCDRVVFFESSHEDMPNFMNAADLVVLPSISTPKWKEQYGRVIQEVQACGRVMVASRSGAIPEVMDGHGHLVPEGDVSALAATLRALLARGEFLDLDAAASARANRSIERQAELLHSYMLEEGGSRA